MCNCFLVVAVQYASLYLSLHRVQLDVNMKIHEVLDMASQTYAIPCCAGALNQKWNDHSHSTVLSPVYSFAYSSLFDSSFMD